MHLSTECRQEGVCPSLGIPIALEVVCRLANLEPERTARILAAAEGEKKPSVEKMLNTKQAAAVLGCHPKTLLRYGLDGRLHPIRRSQRLIRWRQSEIEKLLMGGFEGQGRAIINAT